MMDLSFDFGDKYHKFNGYLFAFRIFTLDNIYGVDFDKAEVASDSSFLRLVANRFFYAGGRRKVPGLFEAILRRFPDDHVEISCKALFESTLQVSDRDLKFEEWKIKGVGILIKGLNVDRYMTGSFTFENYNPEQGVILNYPRIWTSYNRSLPTPLMVVHVRDSDKYFYSLSMDEELRPKRFAIRSDFNGDTVIELYHEEKATMFSNSINVPTFRVGFCKDPWEPLTVRMNFMEEKWGLKSWEDRDDVPYWMRRVSLVVNMHGKHWTGYIFNTFNDMIKVLEWISKRIEGYRVLVFLPGFNGRYYYDYPIYDPDPDLGGVEGFRNLVNIAHELGMHVVPMYGAVAAGFRWVRMLNLEDAIFRDKYDLSVVPPNWVDWDADRERDDIWIPLNLGNRKFLDHLYNSICKITDEFMVDGAFLDIPHLYVNDHRYDMYEGLRRLVIDLKRKYGRNFLIFGEAYYDALFPLIPFYHVPFPKNYSEFFHKYIRTAYHLSHPAPGRGSTGVHEQGRQKFFIPNPEDKVIPTLCVVEDTIEKYGDDVEKVIEAAKIYARINNLP
jgi:hypothetical protein